jgi:hypothetical protein
MGVKNIWVIDPATRQGFDCSAGSWIEMRDFAVAGRQVELHLDSIFADIDEK